MAAELKALVVLTMSLGADLALLLSGLGTILFQGDKKRVSSLKA